MNWIIEHKIKDNNKFYKVINHRKVEVYNNDLISLLQAIQVCFAYSGGEVKRIIIKGLNKNDYDNYLDDFKDVIEWKN